MTERGELGWLSWQAFLVSCLSGTTLGVGMYDNRGWDDKERASSFQFLNS